jgi:hypothetical protein
VVGDRRRKDFDSRKRLEVEESRPAGDRLAVLIEAPHEAGLRAAMDAARVDAIVVGGRAIAVEAKMDLILGDRGVPADQRRCGA